MDLRLLLDFEKFLKLLKKHDVCYLLIGGYAVSHHGYPRTTEDLDIYGTPFILIMPRNS